jgi:hypothetical protein
MKTKPITKALVLSALLVTIGISGCDKSTLIVKESTPTSTHQRLDIGWDEILKTARFDVQITPRSHGYLAEARGKGIIPSGEYAGQRFQLELNATYSGIGFETLIDGEATIRIRGERFESVSDPLLQSFCCGEGHLQIFDGEYVFSVFGQVNHSTAGEPHNHLFAGLASTSGELNMNIADQTGTVVLQADPPHDPGIGLLTDLDLLFIRVDEH